jgi:carbonic anhydrase
MCNIHDRNDNQGSGNPAGRRNFLKAATAATLATAFSGVMVGTGLAAKRKIPLPENVLTSDEALERLMAGNRRYVSGESRSLDFNEERALLVSGQNPYASILSCADSRVSPEFCFDEQRGDLFVARVAGNYLTTDFVATLEYAVAVLHAPLIMVLGHQKCGAVDAAIRAVKKNEQFPGHIQSLASALAPAVRAAEKMPGDLFANTVKMNVVRNVEKLRKQPPILSRLVSEQKVLVVGGVYNLETGKVELVA